MKKLKVVWLCHFVSPEMKIWFDKPEQKQSAPWIDNLIQLFKNDNNIELHIVAPNVFNNKNISFSKDGIYYHFYTHYLNIIPRKIYNYFLFREITKFHSIKNRIHKIINSINPDIIHLHGAENPYYSVGILPFLSKSPTLVTIQGFVRLSVIPKSKRAAIVRNARVSIEDKILKKAEHFGVRVKYMEKLMLEINPKAKFHFHRYITDTPALVKDKNLESKYDCVFFARIVKDKGIEDLLEAISKIKNNIPEVSLAVIGPVSGLYKNYLLNKCNKLNITKNVSFLGFLPTESDVYKVASTAKVSVLPTYHEIISGTIVHSMFLKIPVVAYNVGGIPEVNDEVESVFLVEKHDIEGLANKILLLLESESLRNKLAETAFNTANKMFITDVKSDILNAYNKIIS